MEWPLGGRVSHAEGGADLRNSSVRLAQVLSSGKVAGERTFGPTDATLRTSTLGLVDKKMEVKRRGAIFVLDFVDVPLSLATIWGRFDDAGSWLTDLASAAEEDGEALYVHIGPTWAGGLVTREVEVILGPKRDRGEARVMPLAWRATGLTGMFPMLNGDLELAPLGSQRCRLTLSASYLPPFGDVGRALDRTLLHRVAQSTVRSFLTRVATNLEAGGGTPAASDSTARDAGGEALDAAAPWYWSSTWAR